MFFYAFIVVVVYALLFWLSRRLYREVYRFFYHLTKHRNTSIRLLVVMLLPGTIIHELAHFLVAVFTGVRTGTINLIPKIKDDGQVIAGETQIAQCDPIRFTIIGIAPFLVGTVVIFFLSKLVFFGNMDWGDSFFPPVVAWQTALSSFSLLTLLALMLLFWVINTMFSSKKDLQMAIIPVVLAYIIGFVLFFSGFKLNLSMQILRGFNAFFRKLSFFLLLALVLNIVVWLFFRLVNKILSRIRRN